MYYTYLLKSRKNNQLYIGSTNDLQKRLRAHNNGKEFSTRRYMPWEVLYYEAYPNETSARFREKRLKYNGNAMRELKKRLGIFKNKSGGFTPAPLSKTKSGAGFTLIEVIVAIFILTVGVVGAYSVISQTVAYTSLSSSRLVAAYLTQEGIEIVRNIRDTNWLEEENWDNNLGLGNWEADYDDQTLTSWSGSGNFLNIDTNGYYSYAGSDQTKFKRKITISQLTTGDCPSGNCLNISVLVEWQERGDPYSITVQENLYDWH